MTMVITERETGIEVVIDGTTRTTHRRPRAWTQHPLGPDAVVTDHWQDGRRDWLVTCVLNTAATDNREAGHAAAARIVEQLLSLTGVCDIAIEGEPLIEGYGIGDAQVQRAAPAVGLRTIDLVLAKVDRVEELASGVAAVVPAESPADDAAARLSEMTGASEEQARTVLALLLGL